MLDKLKKIELHDQSLEALQLNFSSKEITIKLGVYNDEKSDYDYSEINFTEVEKIDIGQMNIDDLSFIEISSHEVYETSTKPIIKFVLLLGSSKPSIEFSFSFKDYYITLCP